MDDIPHILDDLGTCIGRLGDLLRPTSGCTSQANLAGARNDVRQLVASLEKVALAPLVRLEVWDMLALVVPSVV